MPTDGRELAAALPDTPCWVEARALLLSGTALVRSNAAGDGAVVLDPALPSGFLVGRADPALLRAVASEAAADFELVVQADAIGAARAALPGWALAPATVFSLLTPWPADGATAPADADTGTDTDTDADADIVVCAPPDEHWLARVPEADEIRFYAALAEAIALRLVDDQVIAVCAAGDVTETLWDVGIDTLEGFRRAGHGAAVFRALATHMAAAGKQPVWCAEDANVASMAMAARLGFAPVGRIAILTPV